MKRLLLNAEPFGYGPSAAMAIFFPLLRPHFETIGYLGKKHTLDLQRPLSYDAIHDVSTAGDEEVSAIVSRYDILFTAMDHKIAQIAARAGLRVFYYDALAWYWPEIPLVAKSCDLYLAQEFFGVRKRLATGFRNPHVVAPIVPAQVAPQPRTQVLINLGGLQNPYWPLEGVVSYARGVLQALRAFLPPGETVVTASAAVAEQLGDEGARSVSRGEMEQLLARSRVAFMTPGLGNIYDAAAFDVPTIWLPPANDSQGQQLALLAREGMVDAAIDWSDLGCELDYARPQRLVLTLVAEAAEKLPRTRLGELAERHFQAVPRRSKATQLLERMGSGGEQRVAALVLEHARRLK